MPAYRCRGPRRSRPTRADRSSRRVIKTSIHPQSGKLSIARILSGTVKADATLDERHASDDERVRLGGLYRLQGKKQEAISEAGPARSSRSRASKPVSTGDTLTSNGHKVLLPRVPAAEPVFAVAIKPKERIDEAKISQMLARIVDEDPALRLIAPTYARMLLLGSGEQHVSIAVERLSAKYKVEVETAPPTIPYQETITGGTEIHSRYKHQTGGHGQFGDVWLRFEPRERGAGVTFEEKIVGGVVPRQFIPAVEKGVREALPTERADIPSPICTSRSSTDSTTTSTPAKVVQDRRRNGRARSASQVQSRGARADRLRRRDGTDALHLDGNSATHRQARPDYRHEPCRDVPASTSSKRTFRRSSSALHHRAAHGDARPRYLLAGGTNATIPSRATASPQKPRSR